jgi:hypothetical protein
MNSSNWNSRGWEIDLLALAMDRAVDQVHLEFADLQGRGHRARLAAARQGVDPGDQFDEGVRLDQIVVGARPQAGDAVVDLAQGRKEQHRRLVALAAQGLDHLDAVLLGHHAIDDHHVEAALARLGQAGLAVGGVNAVVAGLGQAMAHGAGGFEVVLDNQDTHANPQPGPQMHERASSCESMTPSVVSSSRPGDGDVIRSRAKAPAYRC